MNVNNKFRSNPSTSSGRTGNRILLSVRGDPSSSSGVNGLPGRRSLGEGRLEPFRQIGFSLIELMIVIAIAMMLVSLTAINARFFNRAVITSEVNLLHAVCSYLQQTALATNQTQELTFDLADNSYSMHDQIHKLPAHIRFGVLPDAKGPPSSPSSILQEPITFTNNTITFSSDGIISSGTVYLTDSNVLYALSSAVGHVSFLRKYRYDGKWHLM